MSFKISLLFVLIAFSVFTHGQRPPSLSKTRSRLPAECHYLLHTGDRSFHRSKNITRYYFNVTSGQCLPFTYTGYGGNRNNFASYTECMNRCGRGYISSRAYRSIKFEKH